MGNQIISIIQAVSLSRIIPVFAAAFLGFMLSLLSACAPIVSNKDLAPTSPAMYEHWPNMPNNGYAQLVVVNPFIKQCCGATPSYTVSIRNARIDYKHSDLFPIDDFFCVDLPPGKYQVELAFRSKNLPQKVNIPLQINKGETTYLAADVDLRRKKENASLYSLDQQQAMAYVNRALHRIATHKPWATTDYQLNQADTQAIIQKRLRRQLKCEVVLPKTNP